MAWKLAGMATKKKKHRLARLGWLRNLIVLPPAYKNLADEEDRLLTEGDTLKLKGEGRSFLRRQIKALVDRAEYGAKSLFRPDEIRAAKAGKKVR